MTLSVLPIVSPVQAQVAQNTATEGQVIQTAEAGDSGFGQVLEVAMQSGDVSAAQNQSNLFTMTLETLQTQEIIPSLPEDVDSTAVYTDEMGLNAAQIQNASQPIIQPSDINAEIDNTQLIDSYSETIELPEITPQKSYADDSFGSESKSLPDNLDNVNNGYDISQENIPIDFNNQAVNANAAANIQPSLQTEVQALDDVLPSEFDEVSMESLSLKRPKAINQVKEVKLESITSAEEIADLEANLEYNNDIDNANLETPRYNEAELVDAEPEVILNSKSSLEVGLDLNKTVSSNSAASADEIVKEIKAGEALASENISANQVSAEIKPASNSSGNQDSSFAEKKDNETGISDNNNSGHITNGSNKTEFAQKLEKLDASIKEPALPVVDQVKSQITKNLQTGTRQMTVQLDPVELGKVEISISIDKDSSVKQIFVNVERRETLEMLGKDLANLEKNLNDTGIKLTTGDINLSLMSDRSFSDHQREFMEEQKEFLKSLDSEILSDEADINVGTRSYNVDKLLDIVA